MGNDDFGSKSMWEYLGAAIVKQWPNLEKIDPSNEVGNTYFQYSGEPISANWEDGKGFLAWQTANAVPANLDGFYQASASTVAEEYSTYILAIAPANYEQDPTYQNYYTQLTALNNKVADLEKQAMDDYIQWTQQYPGIANGVTFPAWQVMPGTTGPTWTQKISEYTPEIAGLNTQITQYAAAVNLPLSNARTALTDAGNQEKLSRDGAVNSYLVTTMDDLTSTLADWASRGTQAAPELDITLSKEDVVAGSWNTVVNSTVSRGCCSISTHTDIDYSRVVLDTNFKIHVEAVGAKIFNIQRGDWFRPEFLKGENVTLPASSNFTMSTFFGEKGTLHMVPVQAFVIYKPQVTITVSTQTYTETIKKWYDSSASISFFGMHFSLDGGEDKFVTNGSDNTTVIKLSSFSDVQASPLLFGMTSQSFYRQS